MRVQRLRLKGYKNFTQEVILDGLRPVNVLHGANNVGKSNLLEAVGLFFGLLELLPTRTGKRRRAEGDPEPTIAKRVDIDPRQALRLGFPLNEIFNLWSPTPIEIECDINIGADELERAGLKPLRSTEPVRVALRLSRSGDSATLELVNLQFGIDEGLAVRIRKEDVATFTSQVLSLISRDDSTPGRISPRYALIKVDRSASTGATTPDVDVAAERGTMAERGLIPPRLSMQLFDASQSQDAGQRLRWQDFVKALGAFRDMLGEGEVTSSYDRREDRAELVLLQRGVPIPFRLLGSAAQQIASLLGIALMSNASILGIEEPELNLSVEMQARLRDVLIDLTNRGATVAQLLLSSHTITFETEDHFLLVKDESDGPSVAWRPVREARLATRVDLVQPPPGGRAPLSYVSREGLVVVPDAVRDQLGLRQGGGVCFVSNRDGHIEMLTDEQMLDLLESSPEATGAAEPGE